MTPVSSQWDFNFFTVVGNNIERSVYHLLFPLMIISCKTVVKYHNQDTDVGIIH